MNVYRLLVCYKTAVLKLNQGFKLKYHGFKTVDFLIENIKRGRNTFTVLKTHHAFKTNYFMDCL